jgi:hypothetical protein
MRSVGRITRIALAASIALAAVFSFLADVAFPGRSSATTRPRSSPAVVGTDPSVRVALPPRNGGDGLAPPVVAPQPAAPVAGSAPSNGGAVATSGGS